MNSLKDVGFITVLMLMAISAAAGYFGNKFEDKIHAHTEGVQVNVQVDLDGKDEVFKK